ncbi:MAG: sugar phosphate isomerase/epimerase [Chloroflexi bacterium]|nr:sugar phosphate isomerase/epimerase [Chloroflexota bacterium]MCI0644845.1 sugar phosphate isomerase/epimerase [Chloroflexota bacterium]MCI0731429.1 sugar phosphate isomerase/epimerase [Chloroflexota bacterium]
MNQISFMSANYVARPLGYRMTRGWGEGDKATNEAFRPLETFGQRFIGMLQDIRALGFKAIDLWLAHLNPLWATSEHVATARAALEQHGLPVVSLAGGFGSTPEEFEASCRLAVALNTNILAGSTAMLDKDRPFVVATLQAYGLKLGLENHPEKRPEEMLAKIGDSGDGVLGTTIDTGWYGTQGYDAAEAIDKLKAHLVHVHLKDVLAPGAHETCRYGRGCVPIEGCVQMLQRLGYQGGISVEHEPEHFDPSEDCRANLAMLQEWLRAMERL